MLYLRRPFQTNPIILKHNTRSQTDPTTPTVGRPLIKKVGSGYYSGRNAEISFIECIKKVGPKLDADSLAEFGIFYHTEIDQPQTIGAKYISSGIANTLSLKNTEEIHSYVSLSIRAHDPPARGGEWTRRKRSV